MESFLFILIKVITFKTGQIVAKLSENYLYNEAFDVF